MAGHEGWPSVLFVEPVDDSDTCGICMEVLEDAVETHCGHSYCDQCIRDWLQQREVCPSDQQPLTLNDCRPMVRDRRRILDLKVKCPFDGCGDQMELRSLRRHQRNCKHKPDGWEDPRGEEEKSPPASPVRGKPEDENKSPVEKPAEPQFVIELIDEAKGAGEAKGEVKDDAAAAQAAYHERVAKEEEERDRAYALQMQMQMQEQERLRQQRQQRQAGGAGGGGNGKGAQQKSQRQINNVHVHEPLELAPANDGGPYVEFYQAGEGRPEGIGEGLEGAEILRPPKRNRCCNDKIWCCFCCVFWIVALVIGGFIWISGGVSEARDALSL